MEGSNHSVTTIPSHRPHPKSKFSLEEDCTLRKLVSIYGNNDWTSISSRMVNRNPRQCRERWNNYLSPSLSHMPWSPQEDLLLRYLYREYGPKWVTITKYFPARTDTNIKNRWMLLMRQDSKIIASLNHPLQTISKKNDEILPKDESFVKNVKQLPSSDQDTNIPPLNPSSHESSQHQLCRISSDFKNEIEPQVQLDFFNDPFYSSYNDLSDQLF